MPTGAGDNVGGGRGSEVSRGIIIGTPKVGLNGHLIGVAGLKWSPLSGCPTPTMCPLPRSELLDPPMKGHVVISIHGIFLQMICFREDIYNKKRRTSISGITFLIYM